MTEKEEKILQNFEKLIPVMSELEKEKLISFGEGLIFFKSDQPQKKKDDAQKEWDNCSVRI